MTKTIIQTLTVVALAGTLVVADATAAERHKVPFLNNGRGVRSLPELQAESGPMRNVAQIQGVVRSGRGDTIRVGRMTVRLTPRTAVQSIVADHADAMLKPRALNGRTVTVFGRPVGRGKVVEASLVIVTPEPHEFVARGLNATPGGDESRYTIRGASGDCGQLRPGAPE